MKIPVCLVLLLFMGMMACQDKKAGKGNTQGADSNWVQTDTSAVLNPDQNTTTQNQLTEKESQDPKKFNCVGNEPFWHLEVSEKGIRFEELDSQKQEFEYKAPKKDGNLLVFESKNEEMSIKIRLKKEKCSDSMSDDEYAYSVQVVLDKDKVYKGCANVLKKKKKKKTELED